MASLAAVLVVKLLDTVIIVAGIGLGLMARSFVQVIGAAIVLGTIVELLVIFAQTGREHSLVVWAVGVLAAFVWIAATYFVRSLVSERKA